MKGGGTSKLTIMQTLTLIKICPEIELTHLYEHLYLRQVVRLFKSHGLLNFLDYRYTGRTYHGGFIWIEIIFYSKEAKGLINNIKFLKLSFDVNTIKSSLAEVIAEKKVLLGGKDNKAVIEYLQQLDATAWKPIEHFDSFDANSSRRSRKLVWTTDSVAKTRQLKCELSLDSSYASSRRELIPLFHVIATAIQDNLANGLAEKSNYFMITNDPKQPQDSSTKSITMFRIWQAVEPPGTVALSICKADIKDMISAGLIEKLRRLLTNTVTNQGWTLVNELDIYSNTLMLLGRVGWRTSATKKNIKSVLKHITLRLVKGREERTLRIANLL